MAAMRFVRRSAVLAVLAAGACTLGPRGLDSELAPALRFAPSLRWPAVGEELGRLRRLPPLDGVLNALLRHETEPAGKDWPALLWSPSLARDPEAGPAAVANGLRDLARALLGPPPD